MSQVAKQRTFGKTNLQVGPFGLGCMGMSTAETITAEDDEESLRVIEYCLNHGINLFNTADFYGDNELLLAKAIKRFGREKMIIADKFGVLREGRALIGVDGSPAHVRKSIESSLKRLETDYIDIFTLARVDHNVPIEETVKAMAELVKEGKVRHLGLSEVNSETLRRAYAVHPIATVEIEYSLWALEIEPKLLPTCRELGVTIMAYSPLGRGFLTGEIRKYEDLPEKDFRRMMPRFAPENFDQNIVLLHKIEEFAKAKGCTPSQLAIAWCMAQGDDIFPIPGTKKVKRMEENFGALSVTLTTEELAKIREILNSITIVGDRYPARFMSMLQKQ